MSDEHEIHGRIEACRWSYGRSLISEGLTETVVTAQLTVTGAVYDVSGRPVTLATVRFGKPAGGFIGKIRGSATYELLVTMPLADLPSFAAATQGARPAPAGCGGVGRRQVGGDLQGGIRWLHRRPLISLLRAIPPIRRAECPAR